MWSGVHILNSYLNLSCHPRTMEPSHIGHSQRYPSNAYCIQARRTDSFTMLKHVSQPNSDIFQFTVNSVIYIYIHTHRQTPTSAYLVISGLPRPEKNLENKRNKQFISFKPCAKREQAVTWWNPAAQTRPVLDSSSFVPVAMLPRELATILLLVFSLFELVAVFVFRKQQEEWRSQWIPTIGWDIF